MADISDLLVPCDIEAGYSPRYVKLAWILRARTESGQYQRGGVLPAIGLASEHTASLWGICCALAMLAANRYVSRPGIVTSCSITWQAGTW
jgi:hypothetical protein